MPLGGIICTLSLCGCQTASNSSEMESAQLVETEIKWPYDRQVITAIQRRWQDLLRKRPTPKGKVVVEFNLRANGSVDGIRVADYTVGELYKFICQKAIEDVAPFQPWPKEMRDELKSDVRRIRFTFFYK